MKITLSKSKKEDLKEIAKIYMKEFSKAPYNETWTPQKAIFKISSFQKLSELYTIKANNKVIGFIVINPTFMCPGDVAFGEEFAIKEEFQNKGIGTWTLNEIFRIYKKKGFKTFMGIANKKSKAFKLYKKLGILESKNNTLIEKQL